MKKLSTILLAFAVFLLSNTSVSADAKLDYEFQLAQYRRSYTEFTQLKRDYLQNPTLDNQQKSIITAKQSLLARDLAKASYARYMADLINSHNTAHPSLLPVLTRLSEAVTYFTLQSRESQKITTPKDLKDFSEKYRIESIIHDRSFYYGQVAAKLANLIKFQISANNILGTIYPKLPDPQPIQLKARLEEIPLLAEEINQKISQQFTLIIPEFEESSIAPEQFFTNFITEISGIRTRQSALVDQLIDIDLNYAQL